MVKRIMAVSLLMMTAPITSAEGRSAADLGNPAVSVVSSFEKIYGVTEGKRRNHTKGFCFNASFSPVDNEIQDYSSSLLFKADSAVTGRFSHSGGNSKAPDNKPNGQGMALSITTSSGAQHIMAMNDLDFFPVATPEALAELFHANTQGPEAVGKFKESNKEFQAFVAHTSAKESVVTAYESKTYNSVNSFYLVNDEGEKIAVRWSFVPSKQQDIVVEQAPDFFMANMEKNLNDHGIAWDMVVTIANEDDEINNAAIQWTGDHKQIVAAQLKLNSVSTEEEGRCEGINFDPLVLSKGFEPSADPILHARRPAYAISFGKRISEKNAQ